MRCKDKRFYKGRVCKNRWIFIKFKGFLVEFLENRRSWENQKPPENRQKSVLFWASPFTMHLVCTLLKKVSFELVFFNSFLAFFAHRGRVFRGFQRFSEVFRDFQRFSEVFQRPSQSPSQSAIFLSELRVVLPLIVLPLKTPTKNPFRDLFRPFWYPGWIAPLNGQRDPNPKPPTAFLQWGKLF